VFEAALKSVLTCTIKTTFKTANYVFKEFLSCF